MAILSNTSTLVTRNAKFAAMQRQDPMKCPEIAGVCRSFEHLELGLVVANFGPESQKFGSF